MPEQLKVRNLNSNEPHPSIRHLIGVQWPDNIILADQNQSDPDHQLPFSGQSGTSQGTIGVIASFGSISTRAICLLREQSANLPNPIRAEEDGVRVFPQYMEERRVYEISIGDAKIIAIRTGQDQVKLYEIA